MFHSFSWKDTKAFYRTWLKWKRGRHNKSGYKSLLLFFNPWLVPFHVIMLKYPPGSYIRPHKDAVDGKLHYRLNVVLKPAKKGGLFNTKGAFIKTKILNFFRSDLCEHEVTKVEEGTRYVFSIGWVVKVDLKRQLAVS